MTGHGLRMDELSAEVEVLESKLAKTSDLTAKIAISLQKLSNSAQAVETAVKPIYSKTASLTTLSANIDETIRAIERIRQPSDSVLKEETAIRRGPQRTGLPEYLSSLRRVNDGLQLLQKSNLQSSRKAVQQMTGLLKAGGLQLEEMFRQTLAESSKPVEPLHFVTKQLPFPVLDSQRVQTLCTINDFLCNSLPVSAGIHPNTTNVYAEVRGPYITSSLSSLALATVSTTRRANPTPYDKGSNGISTYVTAMESIFNSEYDNITQLFDSSNWGSIYAATTAGAMGVFKRTLLDLNTFIKSAMATDMCLAYEIIECVTPASLRLKEKTNEPLDFADSLKPIRQTATSTFSFMFDDLKRSFANLVTLPQDCNVCEITIETMGRLQRLAEYMKSAASLLVSLGDGNWKRPYNPTAIPTTYDVGADGSLLLNHFVVDMMEALINDLEAKANTILKKRSMIGVFMVNNVAFIESSATRSEISKIMTPTTMAKVEKFRKDVVKMYMEQWKECAAFLMDVTYTRDGKIPGKAKDGAKEKFKNFNLVFDDLVQKHKTYSFPDKDVRHMLTREIGFIGPLYGRFYDKYKDVINPKYIKYDRAALEAVLSQL
ncbi:hypothetical protein EX30DRAFT_354489 [Ascodesmis nigricans]|uniref:Exocyst complex protein EXO70 n=1 Tax=Ascodesmis nigricans TaxID=341454 RepID=A0A4S2N2P7_9PEZI|nr:hypothetical protein EX30DRAFT_354489 [Ascodesmis nigricans]